ncbi:hypothetical protein ABMA28_009559 [Loxostege sticticalis]|uniref:Kazal-like domain-containing protein n=1 Tax=Loxostege sticticalis TaxID=481309 RepID=A0ABD0SDP3_LOXSC
MKIFYAFTILFLLASMLATVSACVCTTAYTPVCGANGQTYSNMCTLKCAGVPLKHRGSC